MKVRKREIFDAEQWFPGKKVPGVQGAEEGKWCGCVIAGGIPDKPHVHETMDCGTLIDPGDWIVIDKTGKKCVVSSKTFDRIYEKV